MLKQNKDKTTLVNAIRKGYIHAVAIAAANAENDISFFNKTKGSDGLTVFDSNWPSATNITPEHITMALRRLGFSVITATGAAVKAATLAKLSRSILTMKLGDREIFNGSLIEFFKQPMASNADGTLVADGNSGPSYKDIQLETIKPGTLVDYNLHVPASIGQDVILYAILDTDTQMNAKQ